MSNKIFRRALEFKRYKNISNPPISRKLLGRTLYIIATVIFLTNSTSSPAGALDSMASKTLPAVLVNQKSIGKKYLFKRIIKIIKEITELVSGCIFGSTAECVFETVMYFLEELA